MEVPRSPLDLPEGRSGTHQIVHEYHEPGAILPVATMRTPYHSGEQHVYIRLEDRLRVHKLVSDEHGTWMTDAPEELVQMYEFSKEAKGGVLIGGLGLGVVAHFCATNPNVSFVDVVEISSDVINLARPGLPANVTLTNENLFDFIRESVDWPWDTAYFDIWQGTGRGTWETCVDPLRRLVRERFGDVHLKCWAEEEMLKWIQ